jgi:hypothetical protein
MRDIGGVEEKEWPEIGGVDEEWPEIGGVEEKEQTAEQEWRRRRWESACRSTGVLELESHN